MRSVIYFSGLLLFGFLAQNPTVSAFKIITPQSGPNTDSKAKPNTSARDSLKILSIQFNLLNTQIRDGKITQQQAKTRVKRLLPQIKRLYFQQIKTDRSSKNSFPVEGYNYKAIGGENGNGYLPKGYNFYHGNKHVGHPALDIFVLDKDQNSIDDKTGKPVQIAAVADGVIIAAESNWEVTSLLRGGIYILLYDPKAELLYYYAHNKQLLVKPGDVVKSGQVIATLGRTGLNAYKKRSPTHLHFMALKVEPKGDLLPVDVYRMLRELKSENLLTGLQINGW